MVNSYGRKKRKPIYDEELGIAPTEEQIEKMQKQAKNVAYYWINQSDKTRKELYDKIKAKGITDDVANELLDKMVDLGYIDDERYAENFVTSKMTYEKLGHQAILYKLKNKGIEQHIIDNALLAIGDEDTEENARILAEKRLYPTRNLEKNKRIQNIAAFLARRGYSGSIAFKISREAVDQALSSQEE